MNHCLGFIFILVVHPGGNAQSAQNYYPVDPRKTGQRLTVAFALDGGLWNDYFGATAPASEGIFYKEVGRWNLAQSLGDFEGLVTLSNVEAVLSFVRLRTCQSTQLHSEMERIFEITVREDLSPKFFYGLKGQLELVSSQAPGFQGVIPRALFRTWRLHGPKITRKSDGWAVIRYVIRKGPRGAGFKAFTLKESVSVHGRYGSVLEPLSLPKDPRTKWRDRPAPI